MMAQELSNAPDPIADAYNIIVFALDGSPSNFLNTADESLRGALNLDETSGSLFHKGVLLATPRGGNRQVISLTEHYDPVATRMGAEKPTIMRIAEGLKQDAIHLLRVKDGPIASRN